jgi:hypothetical protein
VTLTVIWVICSVILSIMGPFGSYLSMDFPGRLAYWSAVVAGGTYCAHFLRLGFLTVLGGRWSQFRLDAVMLSTFAVLYTPLLHVATDYVTEGRTPYSLLEMLGFVVAVGGVLIVIREALGLHAPGLDRDANRQAEPLDAVMPARHGDSNPPPIIQRLPEPVRGTVFSISGSDHYVDVKTDAGSSSILLRFSDALREVEPVPGQRVHRSHWVADAAVDRMRRVGRRHFVVLKTGDEVPVSRTYEQDAQQRWGAAAE